MSRLFSLVVTLVGLVNCAAVERRWSADAVAPVDLAINRGSPQHLASGIIYGIPDVPNQIPDHFYTDIGLHWFRAGGGQMTEPNRGWSWGDAEMEKRWESTLSNYRTVRKYNGKFQLLLHDLWGTDFTDESMEWPVTTATGPTLTAFWTLLLAGSLTTICCRDCTSTSGMSLNGASGRDLKRSGFTCSVGLQTDFEENTWWSNFLSYVAANDSVPDLYTWHHIEALDNPANDLQNSLVTFSNMRSAAGAPEKPININEYLNLADELNPATTVWHLSRFERYDTSGLRSNWRGGPDGSHLRDFLVSLIWRDNENLPYHPNGDWQALKYYNLNMTVRALAGVRVKTGTWALTFKNLSAVGLPPAGELKIQTWGFTYEIPEAELDAPTDRGIATHSYTNDEITIAIYQTEENWKTAWAFEFLV
ncbi:hypothetical protein CFRS1_v001431 [Colletotrichum fructicola]|nr:hypothetical protein CFRS1_v001431 [Colletotrichum fructicola]